MIVFETVDGMVEFGVKNPVVLIFPPMISKLCTKQRSVIIPLGIVNRRSDIMKQVCKATFLYASSPSSSCHPPPVLLATRCSSKEPTQVPSHQVSPSRRALSASKIHSSR